MITCYFENNNKANLRHVTVDAIVVKNNRILLEKRGALNGKPILESGKWALPGGFMERNENLIEATKREVLEECGWEIDNLILFKINDRPDRPKEDRQNVSMIFVANAVRQTGSSDEEAVDVMWIDLDKLPPEDEFAFDHFNNIKLYIKYLKEDFPIPLLG